MIARDIWTPGHPGTRRLVLVRHGRTEWNAVGRAQGHANVSLDDVGRAEAARAAPFLASYQPVFIWSSDLARARETAECLLALLPTLELKLDPRLREYDVGQREGLTFLEFREQYPEVYAAFAAGVESAVPCAESTAQVCERMTAVLSEAAEVVGVGDTGVIIGHGAALRTGLLAFMGVPQTHAEMLAGMANCAWAVLELRGGRGWQIVDYNARTLPEPVELADDPHG